MLVSVVGEIESAGGGAMAIRADNRDAVDPFAGDDYEAAVVPTTSEWKVSAGSRFARHSITL